MRLSSLVGIWPSAVLIFLCLGTIYLGVATPTEAAGVGCVGALVIGFQRKALNWKIFKSIFRESMVTSGMILLIVAAAMIFGYTLTLLQTPQHIAEFISNSQMSKGAILFLIIALLYLMGMFMDVASMILIATPILVPIVNKIGFIPCGLGS